MVVAGSRVVLGTDDGFLVSLDAATGREVWKKELGRWLVSPEVAVSGGALWTGAEPLSALEAGSQALHAFDLETGDERLCCPTGGMRVSSPCLVEGCVYAGSSDGWFHAVDAETGEHLWAVEIGGWGPGAPVPHEGRLIVGTTERFVLALDGSTGQEVWKFDPGWEMGRFAPALAVAEGRCYVAAWNGHLYVLEASTGRLLDEWILDQALLTRPVVVGDLLLVGGRGHRLWALEWRTGKEVWSVPTRRRIQVTPVVVDDTVYIGSDDGRVQAVDLTTGGPRWERPFEIAGKIRALATDGVRLFVGAHALRLVPPSEGTPPGSFGSRGIQAAVYEGEVIALLHRPEGPRILAPSTYARRGEWEMAGISAALRGEFREAARLFERAGQPLWAARLYREVGDWEKAASMYERASRPEEAEVCYLQGGRMDRVGEMREAAGRYAEAAVAYLEAGDLLRAAQNYERAGEVSRARDLYREAGDREGFLRTSQALGDPAAVAEVLAEKGRWPEAAEIWRGMEDWERAAQCYEKAGEWKFAGEMWVRAGDLEKAIHAYRRAGDPERMADLLEEQGRWLEAARALEEVARQLEAGVEERPEARERLIQVYTRMAELYEQAFEGDEAERCRRRILFFRQLPLLEVRAEGSFVYGGWDRLTIHVQNEGFGVARNVQVEVMGQFEVDPPQLPLVRGLRPGHARSICCHVKAKEFGRSVPMRIRVTYEWPDGTPAEPLERTAGVPVEREEAARRYTPTEIYIGHLVQGDMQVAGDFLTEGAQKGDRVEIRREGPRPQGEQGLGGRSGAEGVRCPQCGRETEKAKFCRFCGARLENR
jgi:outer membrane protein assembly factor BamB